MSAPGVIRRSTAAITINALPVKSSAPPTTTRISPSAKATPPSTRCGPKPGSAPAIAMHQKAAPKPMKAPASRASVAIRCRGSAALTTPAVSISAAISAGS